jgi:hypothetical protein
VAYQNHWQGPGSRARQPDDIREVLVVFREALDVTRQAIRQAVSAMIVDRRRKAEAYQVFG